MHGVGYLDQFGCRVETVHPATNEVDVDELVAITLHDKPGTHRA
jgi:hypothetical protein